MYKHEIVKRLEKVFKEASQFKAARVQMPLDDLDQLIRLFNHYEVELNRLQDMYINLRNCRTTFTADIAGAGLCLPNPCHQEPPPTNPQ